MNAIRRIRMWINARRDMDRTDIESILQKLMRKLSNNGVVKSDALISRALLVVSVLVVAPLRQPRNIG